MTSIRFKAPSKLVSPQTAQTLPKYHPGPEHARIKATGPQKGKGGGMEKAKTPNGAGGSVTIVPQVFYTRKAIMDKEVFKQRLDVILSPDGGFDPEKAHIESDDLLIEALTELGYDCSAFNDVEFWYA